MNSRSYWEVRNYDSGIAQQLQEQLRISSLTAGLLVQRGIDTVDTAQRFLHGTLDELSSPFGLGGMEQAVRRIEKAMQQQEKVVVYGDYDADGICSVVLLKSCFDILGYPVDYYVPGRFEEGYGLNLEAVDRMVERGYRLMICVDCGIKSLKEVKHAAQSGLDVIITDHHTPGEQLPEAVAIVNPKIDGNGKNYDLAGVGVACKLAHALCCAQGVEVDPLEWLDLVCVATIADIVPLRGDNRLYVKYGLERVQHSSRVGLQALIKASGLEGTKITTTHIGFVLAPRLNSAGRMDNAAISIQLLLSKDLIEAESLAQVLCKLNTERRQIEEEIFKEAVLQVENEYNPGEAHVLVLAGENWHQGVIGIVASRLLEKYHRPAILISWNGDIGRGSGRSTPGVNIYQALEQCSEQLVQFGGHKLAAGLTLNRADFLPFKHKINQWIKQNFSIRDFARRQYIDLEVDITDINYQLYQELESLQPCGEGNPLPVLAIRNVEVHSPALVGQGHYKSKVSSRLLDSIAFNRVDFMEFPTTVCYHDQAFVLSENEFRGQKSLQLRIKDMKPSYQPDGLDSGQTFDSCFVKAVEICINEIKKGRPVLYLCPTYRSLNRHIRALESFFHPRIIAEMHGKMPIQKRIGFEDNFQDGQPRIYVMTRSYLDYILNKYSLPAKLHNIIQSWPDIVEPDILNRIQSCEIYTMEPVIKSVNWVHSHLNQHLMGTTLIYTNRKKTVQEICRQVPDGKVEAGLDSIYERRKIRQVYWHQGSGALLTDGAYSGSDTYQARFDRVIFADVPFSEYESRFILEQVKGSGEIGVLFGSREIKLNHDYLQHMYPGADRVNIVFQCLCRMKQDPIRGELNQLALIIEKFVDIDFKPVDLLPILYILADLGLCQIKKKGSIIEIKIKSVEKMDLIITNSPYYLEGQAEIEAFSRYEEELKKYLVR